MRKILSLKDFYNLSFYIICLVTCSPLFISVFTKDNYILPKEIFILGFAGAGIFLLVLYWLKENKFPRFCLPILFSFLFFILFYSLSANTAINIYEVKRKMLFLASCFILYVLGHSINDDKKIKGFITCVFLVAVIASCIGLMQYLDIRVLPEPFYAKEMWKYKAFSSLGNPQFLAVLLIQVLPLVLVMLYVSDFKIFYFSGFLVLIFALAATNTRSAWVVFSLIAVFMLFLFYLTKNQKFKPADIFSRGKVYFFRKNFIFVTFVFLLLAGVLFSFRYTALNSDIPAVDKQLKSLKEKKNVSVAGRLFIWEICVDIFKDNFFLGQGAGNFKVVYPLYKAKKTPDMDIASYPENYFTRRQYAHNDYMEILAEGGMFTFSAFVFFVLSVLFFAIRNLFKLNRVKQPLAIGLMGSVFSFFVMALLFFPLNLPASAALFFLNLGLFENYIFKATGKEYTEVNFSAAKKFIYAESLFFVLLFLFFNGYKIIVSDYFLKKGQVAIKDKDIYTAVTSFEKGLRLTPHKGQLLYGRGYLEYVRGKYEDALPYLFASAFFLPERGVYYTIGKIFTLLDNPAKAKESYLSALKIDPHFSDAYLNLGILEAKFYSLTEAIKYFELAYEYARTKLITISALNNLSNCYLLLKDEEKAKIYKSKMDRRLYSADDILNNEKFMSVVS